jgi:integrase
MGTIRKRGKKWTVDYTDGAGRRRRFDVATKEEAQRELARRALESGQALPSAVQDPNITIRGYFGARADATDGNSATGWIADVQRQVKPRTWNVYEKLGRLHIVPALGHLKVRQLHRAHVRAFISGLFDKGLSRGSVRVVLAVLRMMLNGAIEDGLILANPAFGVGRKMKLGRAHDPEETEIRPFTFDQLARFLEVTRVREPLHYPLFATMALAGLRIGEALALRWSEVDVDQRDIRVARTLAPAAKDLSLSDRLGTPKSGRARTVDMNATLVNVLRELLHAAKVASMRRGDGGTLPPFVFSMSAGPLDEARVRKAFARIVAAAGLPAHHTPHCLRHTFCALLLAEGVPPTYVMAQAGHSSIDVTVQNYGRWIPKSDRSLIDRINAKLNPARAALVAAGAGGVDAARLNVSQTSTETASFPNDSARTAVIVG